MYECKLHTIATLVQMLGKTTIKPGERVGIVKVTDKVAIGYIVRNGRLFKITMKKDRLENLVKL